MIADDQGAGLRHMVHTRLVVKEVCLPITAFTSSNQLVRLIYECITGTLITGGPNSCADLYL